MAKKKAATKRSETVPVRTKKAEARTQPVPARGALSLLDDLRQELDELWARPLGAWPRHRRPLPQLFGRREETAWLPSTDVYKEENKLVVKADLPGLTKEDVDVSVEDGQLVVKGQRSEEEKTEEKDFYHAECSYGSFYRRVPLPAETDAGKIKAKVSNGVLEVTVPLPKEAKSKAKKISVS